MMTKKVIDRGKRTKTLTEVMPVQNISKNLQSFLEITPVQKEVLLSQKLEDHDAYEDNTSRRNGRNQLSHPSLSHIEQECQESLIQGEIHVHIQIQI